MANRRLRAHGIAPSGPGFRAALRRFIKGSVVVTAFEDAALRTAHREIGQDSNVQIITFADFVGRVMGMCRESPDRAPFGAQLRASLALIVEKWDGPLAESLRLPGTQELIIQRLSELRHWGIDEGALTEAALSADPNDAELLATLAALATRLHDRVLDTGRDYASVRIERCLTLQPLEPLRGVRAVVLAGRGSNPLYERWLSWLADGGARVELLIDHIPGHEEAFAGPMATVERLGVELEPFGERRWTSALFHEGWSGDAPNAALIRASDPLAECEWAVRTCLEWTAGGTAPGEIAVFCRQPDKYVPLMLASAERLGLALDFNLQMPLLSNGFASLMLRLMRAMTGDDVRQLARVGRSSYLRSSPEARERLWAATQTCHAKGKECWDSLLEWSSGAPPELSWLTHALEWRREWADSNLALSEWASRLRLLIHKSMMADLSAELDSPALMRDRAAQTVLQSSLEHYAFAYDSEGRQEVALRRFVAIAERVWQGETSYVSGQPGGVRLVAATASLGTCEALIMLGMVEGVMPRRSSEDALLRDKVRAHLTGFGLGPPLRDSSDLAAEERAEFLRLCGAPERQLVAFAPESDHTRDNVPAFYLEEIAACLGERVTRERRRRDQLAPPAEECLAPTDLELRLALDSEPVRQPWPQLETVAVRTAIRPDFSEDIAPEELATVLQCAFMSGMRYRTKATGPPVPRALRSLAKVPIEARLPTIELEGEAREALLTAARARLDEISPTLESWEIELYEGSLERLVDEWVEREFKARELWKPTQVEVNVPLNEGGLHNRFKAGNRTIGLSGAADALYTSGDHSVIRFYQSHRPGIDPSRDTSDEFLYDIYLACQYRRSKDAVAVEVDSMGDSRHFYAVRNSGTRGLAIAGWPKWTKMLESVGDAVRARIESMRRELDKAVTRLDRSSMRPRPGDQCERCAFGELCRVSQEFGEAERVFEMDGGGDE